MSKSRASEIREVLVHDRSKFALALQSTQEVANKYLLAVYNTIILNDRLMECSPESIRDAAITSAVLGVAIDARQYAYLVPYNGKAQFQMSYKGYVYVAKRDVDVDNIQSNIVYEDDTFSIDVGMNTLSHIPNLESPKYGKNEDIKYVYAQVRFRAQTGRSTMFEVMTKGQIDEIRATSKSGGAFDKYGKPTIWEKHYGEMARKTVIKRLCKHAQLGDTAHLDEVDNSIEQGKIINVTPSGEVTVDDSTREDKEEILKIIDSCTNQQELDKIFADNRDKIEELANSSFSGEIAKASKSKRDFLYAETVKGLLDNCEDDSGIDAVYNNHLPRLNQLKAALRNEVTEHYCNIKQSFVGSFR